MWNWRPSERMSAFISRCDIWSPATRRESTKHGTFWISGQWQSPGSPSLSSRTPSQAGRAVGSWGTGWPPRAQSGSLRMPLPQGEKDMVSGSLSEVARSIIKLTQEVCTFLIWSLPNFIYHPTSFLRRIINAGKWNVHPIHSNFTQLNWIGYLNPPHFCQVHYK